MSLLCVLFFVSLLIFPGADFLNSQLGSLPTNFPANSQLPTFSVLNTTWSSPLTDLREKEGRCASHRGQGDPWKRLILTGSTLLPRASQMAQVVNNLPPSAGATEDAGLIPGSGRPPGVGNGHPLQYSCRDNPTDGGAWWATVHRVIKSWTRLK